VRIHVPAAIAFAAVAGAAAWQVAGSPPEAAPVALDEDVAPPTLDEEPVALPTRAPVSPAEPSSPPAAPAAPDAPSLEDLDVGRVRWPMPRDEDFETARQVTLAHLQLNEGGDSSGDEAPSCVARELSGWLRLTCRRQKPSVSVLGGSTNGVTITAGEQQLTVTMPLAPGDSRVFQLARLGSAYWEGEGLIADGILSETWVGTSGPHVTIHGPATPDQL
jgi:hypothetical protein